MGPVNSNRTNWAGLPPACLSHTPVVSLFRMMRKTNTQNTEKREVRWRESGDCMWERKGWRWEEGGKSWGLLQWGSLCSEDGAPWPTPSLPSLPDSLFLNFPSSLSLPPLSPPSFHLSIFDNSAESCTHSSHPPGWLWLGLSQSNSFERLDILHPPQSLLMYVSSIFPSPSATLNEYWKWGYEGSGVCTFF